jgi:hypothetical protein
MTRGLGVEIPRELGVPIQTTSSGRAQTSRSKGAIADTARKTGYNLLVAAIAF